MNKTIWEARAFVINADGKEILFKKSHSAEGLQKIIDAWYRDQLYFKGKRISDYEERKKWADQFIKNIRYEIAE